MIKFPPPCDMSKAEVYCTWQGHKDRLGYTGEPGTDLASYGQANLPLCAVMGGRISRDKDNGYNMGFGTYVEIDHGICSDGRAYRTLCAHMDSNCVSVGQIVKAGEQIGIMGTTGNSEGVHTHFVLWVDDKNVDAQPYFNSGVDMKPVIPTITPELRVRVTCTGLNVRSGPGVTNPSIGTTAFKGYEAQVYDIKSFGEEVWVKISENEQRWIALYYQGSIYAIFFDVPAPAEPPLVGKLNAVVVVAKTAGTNTVTIPTGDLQDLLQLYKEK